MRCNSRVYRFFFSNEKAILEMSLIDMIMNVSPLFFLLLRSKSEINHSLIAKLARSCRFDMVIKSYPRAQFNSAKLG